MKINLTIPVYNEEVQLQPSIETLVAFCSQRLQWPFEIVIADNASTDATLVIAQELSRRFSVVRVVHLDEKGRGRAIKQVWTMSDATVLTYMDVDLSTNLEAYPSLVAAVSEGGYDLATGSRLLPSSITTRSYKREVISRVYNAMVRAALYTKFSDAQCGFKAVRRQAAEALLPLVEDTGWFMDTELLALAERLGYRICDIPVRWIEDPDSRVHLWDTARRDLIGLVRLRRRLRSETMTRYRRLSSVPHG